MSKTRVPTSTTIAAMYMMEKGTSLCERENRVLENRVHLVRNQRSECGAIMGFTDKSRIPLVQAIDLDAWCYSCLGGALQFIEKGEAA